MQSFIQYYGCFVISIVSLYLIGELAFRIFKINEINSYYSIFLKIVSGTIIFTCIIAIVATQGKTIFILIIPIVGFCIILKRKNFFIQKQIDEKLNKNSRLTTKLLFCVLFASVIFFIRFVIFYQDEGFFNIPHPDYMYYANVSYNIFTLGIENINIGNTNINNAVSPYHYFELWLNAGIAHIFGNVYLPNLMLITFSVLISIIGFGFLALSETIHKKVSPNLIILSFLGLFVTGVFISFYEKYPFLANMLVFTRNSWNYSKLSIIYIVLIIVIINFIKGNKTNAILWFSVLPIFYTSTAPSIFLVIGIYAISNYFFVEKKIPLLLIFFLIVAINSLGIILFYLLFSDTTKNSILIQLNLFSDIKTQFNIIVGSSIQIVILYFPFLILLFFQTKELIPYIKKNHFIFLFFSIFIFSLFSWAAFNNIADAVQFFSNISIPLINILIVILGIHLVNYNKKILFSVFILMVICSISPQLKEIFVMQGTDITELKPILKKIASKNHTGVSFKSKNSYNSIFAKNTNFNFYGNYLLNSYSDVFNIDLSVHQISIDSNSRYATTEMKMLRNAPFYQYVEKQKVNNFFKSIEQSQLDFIKEYKIEYVIIHKDFEIPTYLQPIIKETLNYKGDKFLFVNK
jgi:hypothetical protein